MRLITFAVLLNFLLLVQGIHIPKFVSTRIQNEKPILGQKLQEKHTDVVDYHQLMMQKNFDVLKMNVFSSEFESFSEILNPATTNGIFLSKNMLKAEQLKRIGLNTLARTSINLDISDTLQKEFSTKGPIEIPSSTQCMFLFNTDNQTRFDIKDLKTWSPFNSESQFKVVDYGLLLSFKYLQLNGDLSGLLHSKNVQLGIKSKEILLYNNKSKPLEINSPILVVYLKEESATKDYQDANKKIRSQIMDLFSKVWFKSHKIFQLESFVICSVNEVSNSYCVKANDDQKSLDIFPTFEGSKINYNYAFPFKNEKKENSIQKRYLNVTDISPQFAKFSSIQDMKRVNNYINSDESDKSFKGFKIQVSNPDMELNHYHYTNMTKCTMVEEFKPEDANVEIPIAVLSGGSIKVVDETSKTIEGNSSIPRKGYYSQVIFPSVKAANVEGGLYGESKKTFKREVVEEANEENKIKPKCEPVTWHNLFSRILFGKPESMCQVD